MELYQHKYRIPSARMPLWDYTRPGIYFVTICTGDMKCWFGDVVDGQMVLSTAGRIVEEEWLRTAVIRRQVRLDRYVVMPNHFHGIFVMQGVETPRRGVSTGACRLKAGSLSSMVGQFKSVSTKRIRAAGCRTFSWQPRFYDHLVRRDESLDIIRNYILANPSRWEKDQNGQDQLAVEQKLLYG